MMSRIEQPVKRHGGKSYQAKGIVAQMPPRVKNPNAPGTDDPGWCHFVEPYFGGGSVMFANDPVGISEVAGDTDRTLTIFWQVLQSDLAFGKLQRRLEATPVSEAVFDEAGESVWLEPPPDGFEAAGEWNVAVEYAARFFIRNRQSRQALEKDFVTVTRNRVRRGMNEQVSSWLSAIEGLPWFHERLKRVLIFTRPALDIIRQQDGPRTLLYCDPPYIHSSRSTTKEYGRNEMSESDHEELLACLATIKGRFLLSGYHSDMYDKHAQLNSWNCTETMIDNKASSAKEKEKKVECLWRNY